ncbi:MAG: hypothetical protein DYG83_05385 [Candidatus Brocadia sp. AMX2]|nr:MAG: hypothetical protein EDM70_14165 [Candidatus Brocadia sp. AMX2]MBC6931549.1 hypothetical protein [Candidatus Brocadia sp.]MBL1169190.1 hypothetical protein [Candidatus Brocadia sp. AMX1]MCE7866256.1 hypothetical protein [Candidatus Brocadia sp. AMX2]MCQ3916725.1 hypothetical protein [Candidatus Brocadia sp.]
MKQDKDLSKIVFFKNHFVCYLCEELKPSNKLYCIPEDQCVCLCQDCFEKHYSDGDNVLVVTAGV